MWTRGQATQCLRYGHEEVVERWKEEGRGVMVEIQPEAFSQSSGRIGGAEVLTADGVGPMAIQKEGRDGHQIRS